MHAERAGLVGEATLTIGDQSSVDRLPLAIRSPIVHRARIQVCRQRAVRVPPHNARRAAAGLVHTTRIRRRQDRRGRGDRQILWEPVPGFADRTVASGSETLVFTVAPVPSQTTLFRVRVWLQKKE